MMNLIDKKWQEFKISDIFEISLSSGDNQADLLEEGKNPLVSSGMNNNGVCKYIKAGDRKSQKFKGNVITIDMFGKPFYHPYDFYAVSHGRINILKPKFNMYRGIGIFLVRMIEKSTVNKYSYNRMCSRSRLENQLITLPILKKNVPDFDFMENYMKEKEKKMINKYVEYLETLDILGGVITSYKISWNEYRISDLFDVQIGKAIDGNKVDRTNGYYAYITRKESNNGLDGFIDYNMKYINESRPVMTIGNETCKPFIQTSSFFTGTKVNVMKPKFDANKYNLLFICQSLEKHKSKYSYSYTINSTRLKEQIILLPTTDNIPNYKYMEMIIKNAIKSKLQKYLDYKLA